MNLAERLAALPPPRVIPGARTTLREELARAGAKLVVVDDDPTGTQTAHGVRVYMDWSVSTLRKALDRPESLFFLSTNSRSLPPAEAVALAHEIGANLRRAAGKTGQRLLVASRSDSTLRGHFPAEVDALAAGLGVPVDGVLLTPAFFEAGRYTIDNVHWVDTGGELVAAHQTEFARDPDFGFRHGDLRQWVEEKTGARVRAQDVICISLEDIRCEGPERVAAVLARAEAGVPIVANAACDSDLEVLALGVQTAEARGKTFIYRTAASFVKVRAGLEDRSLLTRADMGPGAGPGLIVAGSYVERTSAQIEVLIRSGKVLAIEASVPLLLSEGTRGREVRRVSSTASAGLAGGETTIVFTTRERQAASDFLAAGRRIMEALCNVVAGIEGQPGFLVAKGGITSIEIARRALGCTEAEVLGQALKGVPVWRLGAASKWSSIPYVVFPGNVGDPASLLNLTEALLGKEVT